VTVVREEAPPVRRDRFGNPLAEALPYARGQILSDTQRDLQKLVKAWGVINAKIQMHGLEAVYNFTGLERKILPAPGSTDPLDDEISPAVFYEPLRAAALAHLGGNPEMHDVAVFNRMAAATLATHLALVKPGGTVIGVSASYSHATVLRAAKLAGAQFVDVVGAEAFATALQRADPVALVVVTRMAVTYDILPIDAIREIARLAHRRDIPVYVDDAGGARVGPAVLHQPKMLELDVDVGATGLDKYGCYGPRVGLLAGAKEWVAKVRAKGFEFGLEARPMLYGPILRSLQAYDPVRVRTLVATTKQVAGELRKKWGHRVTENEVTAQLLPEDLLELAMERARVSSTSILPYEASAALAMLLLRDYDIITVHFAGLPPGTGALLLKFIPPETLQRFGGAARLAEAIDRSLDQLAQLIAQPKAIEDLLLN
jgi:L-seryl-tRNA(Ser) seleniumtransferase